MTCGEGVGVTRLVVLPLSLLVLLIDSLFDNWTKVTTKVGAVGNIDTSAKPYGLKNVCFNNPIIENVL